MKERHPGNRSQTALRVKYVACNTPDMQVCRGIQGKIFRISTIWNFCSKCRTFVPSIIFPFFFQHKSWLFLLLL